MADILKTNDPLNPSSLDPTSGVYDALNTGPKLDTPGDNVTKSYIFDDKKLNNISDINKNVSYNNGYSSDLTEFNKKTQTFNIAPSKDEKNNFNVNSPKFINTLNALDNPQTDIKALWSTYGSNKSPTEALKHKEQLITGKIINGDVKVTEKGFEFKKTGKTLPASLVGSTLMNKAKGIQENPQIQEIKKANAMQDAYKNSRPHYVIEDLASGSIVGKRDHSKVAQILINNSEIASNLEQNLQNYAPEQFAQARKVAEESGSKIYEEMSPSDRSKYGSKEEFIESYLKSTENPYSRLQKSYKETVHNYISQIPDQLEQIVNDPNNPLATDGNIFANGVSFTVDGNLDSNPLLNKFGKEIEDKYKNEDNVVPKSFLSSVISITAPENSPNGALIINVRDAFEKGNLTFDPNNKNYQTDIEAAASGIIVKTIQKVFLPSFNTKQSLKFLEEHSQDGKFAIDTQVEALKRLHELLYKQYGEYIQEQLLACSGRNTPCNITLPKLSKYLTSYMSLMSNNNINSRDNYGNVFSDGSMLLGNPVMGVNRSLSANSPLVKDGLNKHLSQILEGGKVTPTIFNEKIELPEGYIPTNKDTDFINPNEIFNFDLNTNIKKGISVYGEEPDKFLQEYNKKLLKAPESITDEEHTKAMLIISGRSYTQRYTKNADELNQLLTRYYMFLPDRLKKKSFEKTEHFLKYSQNIQEENYAIDGEIIRRNLSKEAVGAINLLGEHLGIKNLAYNYKLLKETLGISLEDFENKYYSDDFIESRGNDIYIKDSNEKVEGLTLKSMVKYDIEKQILESIIDRLRYTVPKNNSLEKKVQNMQFILSFTEAISQRLQQIRHYTPKDIAAAYLGNKDSLYGANTIIPLDVDPDRLGALNSNLGRMITNPNTMLSMGNALNEAGIVSQAIDGDSVMQSAGRDSRELATALNNRQMAQAIPANEITPDNFTSHMRGMLSSENLNYFFTNSDEATILKIIQEDIPGSKNPIAYIDIYLDKYAPESAESLKANLTKLRAEMKKNLVPGEKNGIVSTYGSPDRILDFLEFGERVLTVFGRDVTLENLTMIFNGLRETFSANSDYKKSLIDTVTNKPKKVFQSFLLTASYYALNNKVYNPKNPKSGHQTDILAMSHEFTTGRAAQGGALSKALNANIARANEDALMNKIPYQNIPVSNLIEKGIISSNIPIPPEIKQGTLDMFLKYSYNAMGQLLTASGVKNLNSEAGRVALTKLARAFTTRIISACLREGIIKNAGVYNQYISNRDNYTENTYITIGNNR